MSQTPDVGQLLRPLFAQLDPAPRPRLLAALERIAAERYRSWAMMLPDRADELMACANDEDEVADRIEALFAVDDSTQVLIDSLLPSARQTYAALFDGLDVRQQLALQASAERQGAQAWRAVAATHPDSIAVLELEACAALEVRSAGRLEALLSGSLA
jgi:hypothetical protein